MLTRIAAVALSLLAAGWVVACGDDEPDALDSGDAAEIATLINDVNAAWLDGDAAAVCDRLTERGQRLAVRIPSESAKFGDAGIETCEQGIDALATELSDEELNAGVGDRDYSASDVDIDPTDDAGFNGSTDSIDTERARAQVDVPCLDDSGNSYFAVREDDEWKLVVPFCTGR